MKKKSKFDFKYIEKKWGDFWKKEKIFRFDPKKKDAIFSIDTPPPYISGRMHMGHAFSYSQQDFIARFKRMALAGKGQIFYPFGTDDNGLPTERFIEKTKKVKSKDMGRSEFIKLCIKTLKEVTPECIQDFKDLAISADYNLYYSTIDDHSRKTSQKSFIDLYKQKDAYQKEYPTMWCPDCQTSIAQAELEDREEKSLFTTIKFSCEGQDLLIATTRPELLGACVAVFVNPKDKKHKKFIGKAAKVPLFNHEVPVLADNSAEMEKGTGVLMVCSYGDRFDVDSIKRHNLVPRIIINQNGKLNENAGKYKDLKILEARKKILEDLKKKKLISEQKEINHVVNVHDKCGTEIEFIPTKQWFIKILDKKRKLIELGKKINWHPEFMRKRYENWVNGLEWDWSISRNRHFGVPIPVWYCGKCGEIILPEESELPVDPLQKSKNCPRCNSPAEPEKMVFDTWATSSLSPQIASQLETAGGKVKLPYSLRPQGHDIIRTWAFYTIVKSYLHENKIPWSDMVISGNVSLGGEKMSKSKGNVVSPMEVMEKHGADALRFWASGSKLGSDLDYQEKDLIAGTKMINKLLNASKFVFMNLKDYDPKKTDSRPDLLEPLDKIFLEKLNNLILNSTENFENFEYSKVKTDVEQFFWRDFCDNYLEIVKKRVYQSPKGSKGKISAQYVLYNSLLAIMKMIAPIMPYITEEIYQEYFRKYEKEKSIHLSKWPRLIPKIYPTGNKEWELMTDTLAKIRREKSAKQKAMNAEINLELEFKNLKSLRPFLDDLKNVSNAKEIKEGKKFRIDLLN